MTENEKDQKIAELEARIKRMGSLKSSPASTKAARV